MARRRGTGDITGGPMPPDNALPVDSYRGRFKAMARQKIDANLGLSINDYTRMTLAEFDEAFISSLLIECLHQITMDLVGEVVASERNRNRLVLLGEDMITLPEFTMRSALLTNRIILGQKEWCPGNRQKMVRHMNYGDCIFAAQNHAHNVYYNQVMEAFFREMAGELTGDQTIGDLMNQEELDRRLIEIHQELDIPIQFMDGDNNGNTPGSAA